jgi:Cu+-exporting ATPase
MSGGKSTVEFPVTGMTCASCVRRVEKALGRVEGVGEVGVNLATERAKVVYDPAEGPGVEGLRDAVEKAGYGVGAVEESGAGDGRLLAEGVEAPGRGRELGDLRNRWVVSLVLGGLMMAEMYLPFRLGMEVLAPLLLIQATVVQFWAGAIFYKTAWASARHGGTNMSTLVAVGTSAAYGYSAFVTL